VILLDSDLRPTATVPLPTLADGAMVSVSEQSGLVAVSWDAGLSVFNLTGRQVYHLDHGRLDPAAPCAWTGCGALLWTVAPAEAAGSDAIEVIVVDTAAWTVAGRAAIDRDRCWQTAFFTLLADPVAPVVAVQGVLTNGDGTYSSCLRATGGILTKLAEPPGEGLPAECLLLDVRPAGGEFLMLDLGERDLYLFDPQAQRVTASLDWRDMASSEPVVDDGDVALGGWRPSEMFYLSDERLLTATNDAQLLLLRREPLRLAAQVNLEGYHSEPFTGWDIYVPGANRGKTYLDWFDPWSNGRIVVSGHRIYDLGGIALSH